MHAIDAFYFCVLHNSLFRLPLRCREAKEDACKRAKSRPKEGDFSSVSHANMWFKRFMEGAYLESNTRKI